MNRQIKAHLAQLPFREMVELSRQVAPEAPGKMALVLSGLAQEEDTEYVLKERAMLDSMFTRKKQITIQPHSSGFAVSIPAQNITVYTDDIRDGISQALDNLVALKAMS